MAGINLSHACLVQDSRCCTCVLVVLLASPPKDFPELQPRFPLLFLAAIRANGQSRSVTFPGLNIEGGYQPNKDEGRPAGQWLCLFGVRGTKLNV